MYWGVLVAGGGVTSEQTHLSTGSAHTTQTHNCNFAGMLNV